jgi:hypothetical protein
LLIPAPMKIVEASSLATIASIALTAGVLTRFAMLPLNFLKIFVVLMSCSFVV